MSEPEKNRWYRRSDWQDRWPSSQPGNVLQAAAWAVYDVLGINGPLLSRHPSFHNLYKREVVVIPVDTQEPEQDFWEYVEGQFQNETTGDQ